MQENTNKKRISPQGVIIMDINQIGLIVFGAILTWVYSALTDYRKKKENRKTVTAG